ncbi:esterase/lipase family protein [Erythrobacter sp. GH1-10]|uniref:esterase/lipase family protein n=1 Tax=Erythrobacter sp. GH1-10 TaxID=3349334 RepID=UPI00387843EC
MATRARLFDRSKLPKLPLGEIDLARRIELAREECDSEDEEKGRPTLRRMLGELEVLTEPARRLVRGKLDIPATSSPKTVLILPGFAAHPARMRYLARNLERAGHKAKRWGLGFNWGADEKTFEKMERRLIEIRERYDRPIVLLGWSLGGLYARELAKRQPDGVRKVITMGSPFSGSPRANNVWRVYQFVAGHRVDAPPVKADLAVKPPMETVAMWSPNDGAIAPRSAAGHPGERDRAIALRCTHLGFSYAPEAIYAVLSELERD